MAPVRHLMLVAGEASGDALGAGLIRALKAELGEELRLTGVGGPLMAAEGHRSLFPLSELAVMGLAEVLPRVAALRRRLLDTAAFARSERPDALVTIDSPGFTLRLAKRLAGLGFPRIHYVAPQVWAWRPGRVHQVAGVLDHVLCLFAFEPTLFEAAGLPATWVGHPVVETGIDAGDGAAFRRRHGLPPEATLLLLLAGSRAGEVRRLLPVFREAAGRLPEVTAIVPAAAGVAPMVTEALRGWPVPHRLLAEPAEKPDAFAAADLALAASGTVTLELALAAVPTVVAYRVNPATALIGGLMLQVPHVGLANILCRRELMPEFLQWRATPAALAAALQRLRHDREARARQVEAGVEVRRALAPPGTPPSRQAAAAVLRILAQRR